MNADEEVSHHEVAQWTVGQLRAALDGIPDDTPVSVNHAEGPGGDVADEQVVIAAGVSRVVADEPAVFEIETDFPTGEYYRRG